MSRRPRIPTNWPKMKVRGAYRKYLTNLRNTTIIRMRVNPVFLSNGAVRFDVHPEGSHMIETKTVRDGWGRQVKRP